MQLKIYYLLNITFLLTLSLTVDLSVHKTHGDEIDFHKIYDYCYNLHPTDIDQGTKCVDFHTKGEDNQETTELFIDVIKRNFGKNKSESFKSNEPPKTHGNVIVESIEIHDVTDPKEIEEFKKQKSKSAE